MDSDNVERSVDLKLRLRVRVRAHLGTSLVNGCSGSSTRPS